MAVTLLEILLDKYKAGTLSSSEKLQLSRIIGAPEYKEELERLIDEGFPDPALHEQGDAESMELIYQQIRQEIEEVPVIQMKNSRFKWWAVAAALLILLGTGYYFLSPLSLTKGKGDLTKTESQNNDISAPSITKAILTLASGKQIALDSASNGSLAVQGNSSVTKTADGQIAYTSSGPEPGEGPANIYNTVNVPRGSNVVVITLSDGTKVWLNSNSSLTYPVSFTGKERNTEITGEAYFEVTKNPNMPFTVKKMHDDTKVRVLGTHFNVNSYDDEGAIRVTLLEGSVRVSKGNHEQLLTPGHQAQVQSGVISLAGQVDTAAVMAWKNGQFLLKGIDMAVLMRQIARWYDVDIDYAGKVPDKKFGGSIGRNVNLSAVLEALRLEGVNSRLEGRKLTIMAN